MKNKFFVSLGFLFIFCFVSVGLFAQSSSNEQRLVGTWVSDEDNSFTVTFKSNGTFSNSDGDDGEWYIIGNRITMVFEDVEGTLDFSLSPDGRRLTVISDGERAIFIKIN